MRRFLHATGALLVASTLGTQLFAYQQRYWSGLGTPLTHYGAHSLYLPTDAYRWAWRWGRTSPRTFQMTAMVILGGTALLCLPLAKKREQDATGAVWATKQDLQDAGLFAAQGVVFGKAHGRIVRHDGPEHVLCVGPTRSGKGVGHVIPTLLDWPESVFVFDPKAELYAITAQARRRFSRVMHLHPTSPTSMCLNPLDAIRLHTDYELRDVQIIVDILTDPDELGERGGAAQHFRETTADLLIGLILYGLLTETAPTLAAINALLTLAPSLDDLFLTMHAHPHLAIHRATSMVRDMTNKELSGVLSTTRRALRLFTDPLVARMTSTSDCAWSDLRDRLHPMSMYLSIPFADQERLRPLSRLYVRQMLDQATQKLTGWQHRLLVLLDEVASLKYMPILGEGLQYLAGYGVNLSLITPSLTPLEALYGAKNSFWEGCKMRLIFPPNSMAMAQMFAREVGEALVQKERTSVSREPLHTMRDRTTVSTEQSREPLLSATALQQLAGDQVVLLVGNAPPALLTKAPYYRQRRWRAMTTPTPGGRA